MSSFVWNRTGTSGLTSDLQLWLHGKMARNVPKKTDPKRKGSDKRSRDLNA
jgi:hypothetical protein